MSTKRILSAILSILMLVALAAPVLAYSTPYADLQDATEFESMLTISGTQVATDRWGTASNVAIAATSAAHKAIVTSLTDEAGALHLTATNNTTSASYSLAARSGASNYGTWVNTAKGTTIDLYAKFANLPRLDESLALINDTGATTPNIFGGLVFNIAAQQNNWDGVSTHYNNEFNVSFVAYDNEELGTNAALIIMAGNRNNFANAAGKDPSSVYTYFFDWTPDSYNRYTISIDTVNKTTDFYIDGEQSAFLNDTGDYGTIPTAALLFRTTATSNFLNINLNNAHANCAANNATDYADLYIDQFNVYPDSLTPNGTTAAAFNEIPELDLALAANWVNVLKDLDSTLYSEASWKVLSDAVAAIDLTVTNATKTQAEVDAWTDACAAAYDALVIEKDLDKLYISHTASTNSNATAWTNGALLFTETGYDLADYTVKASATATTGYTLGAWTRIIAIPTEEEGVYAISKIIEGEALTGAQTSVTADEVVPEGGFIYAFHANNSDGAGMAAGGSQYASEEFGMRNVAAYKSLGLAVGDLVTLEGVTVNAEGDSTLTTTGTWVHRYAEANGYAAPEATAIYRLSSTANSAAVENGPQYLARDEFDSFVSSAYIAKSEGTVEIPVTNANFTNAYNYYRDFDPMADEYFNPTFWNAFEGYINYGLQLIENGDQEGLDAISDSGVNGNWFINRFHFKSTAGINLTTGGSETTVNGTGTVIPAATPILVGYDKLYVSYANYDGSAVAWNHGSTIVTKAGVNVSDFVSYGGAVNTNNWRVYICEPTAVADYYKVIGVGGNSSTTRPVIPEGGFAIIMHTNGKTNITANTASVEYNKYNSGLWYARNVHAVYAAGISNGGYIKATGITLNDGAAATLDLTGAFMPYKDPRLNGAAGDHVYREGYITLDAADEQGRTTATRDSILGFKSNAYIQGVSELPEVPETVTVAVEGNGTVTGEIDGAIITNIASFETKKANVVTLTASGEGFKYWVGGNDAVLSTEATLTIPGGKALNIRAIFEAAEDAETVNVYFKDSKTGKIWATKSVAVGTALTAEDLPSATLKGYTLSGWKVYGAGDPVGYEVTATTEVYTVYTRDTSSVATLTIVDGNTVTTDRAFGAVVAVTAKGDNFSYWTLNDVIVSVDRDYRFNAPSAAATLTAVYGAETTPSAVAAKVDLVADGQVFYYLMSRSVAEGATIKETGVLMTRKGTEADLTVDTTVNTVTKGVSTAAADYDVVGFQKDATGKTGTWLVKGYVTYELDGQTATVYTDVASVVIE